MWPRRSASLVWLPSGKRSGDDLRIPLARFFERNDVRWHRGSVTGVFDGGRRVATDSGEVHTDVLVVATGGRYLRRLPGIEHAIIPCEGIAAAESIRDRLAAMEGGTIAVGFASNPKEPGAVRGEAADHGFRTELACIVDALDSGMLVYRRGRWNLALPRMRLFHWLKRRFEARYLEAYR